MIESEIYLRNQDIDVLKQTQDAVDRSIMAGDITVAMEFGRQLRRSQQIQGLALAKLLYDIRERWNEFQAAGIEGDFVDVMQSELSISVQTVQKYSRMWEALFSGDKAVPEEYVPMLMNKPIRGLLLLPAAAREGGLDWDAVSVATNDAEIREEVRKARGIQTSANTGLMMTFDTRTGIIYAHQADRPREVVGKLNVSGVVSDVVDRARERILNNANIKEI